MAITEIIAEPDKSDFMLAKIFPLKPPQCDVLSMPHRYGQLVSRDTGFR
ncbi:hypothetical protein [Parasphingorhabdus halotolerans]|uniref:Uncharacterized protein n=1 Tax=Parasphingorhabdus halotolerans TaxID=2725558 RepID=A0A6H2DMA3_9SPHN|nr:hypothetical protein [Parasphingorhabdus halotolerans]QJB69085.1 hypothetical protein HF685_07130 [Parasphingorhabdus halotolerans]